MRTDLIELRDAICFGYATQHDLQTAKREDVVAIKSDPELIHYRFVASEDVTKGVDMDARSVTWRASDETVDSYGDIVRVDGWDLGRYRKNGQILWGHDHSGLPLAVGRAWKRGAGSKDAALMTRGDWFETGVNEFADGVLRIIGAGGLPGTSVGLRAGEINDPSDAAERKKLGLGPWGVEFTAGHELLEVSVVTVPANPNALQERCIKAIDGELERWLRSGEKSPAFVREFRKSVVLTHEQLVEHLREQRRKSVVVPDREGDAAPEPSAEQGVLTTNDNSTTYTIDVKTLGSDLLERAETAIDELRSDKARLARTVDHLLQRTSALDAESEQLRAQCAELTETVKELRASGAGQSQQPPSGERGAGAAETSSERETDARATAELIRAAEAYAKQLQAR